MVAVNQSIFAQPIQELACRSSSIPNPDQSIRSVVNTLNMNNKLSPENAFGFAPYYHVEEATIISVDGNRIGFPNTSYWTTMNDGALNGATVRIERPVAANQGMTTVIETTVTQWHANTPNNAGVMNGDEVFSGTSARITHDGAFKPDSSYWVGVAVVDENGDQSEWTFAGPVTIPSSPAAGDTSTNVVEARTLTGVVNTGIAAPTNISTTSESGGNVYLVSWDAPPANHGVIIRTFSADPTGVEGPLNDLVDLADATGVQVGDYIVVEKEFGANDADRRDFAHFRYYGSTANDFNPFDRVSYTKTGAVNTQYGTGDTGRYIDIDLEAGGYRRIESVLFGDLSQTWYQSLEAGKTYEYQVRIRRVSGDGTVHQKVDYVGANNELALTSDFQTFTVPFTHTASADTGGLENASIELNGGTTGLRVEIEWLWAGEVGAGVEPMELSPTSRQFLIDGNFSYVRNHDHVKEKPDAFTVDSLTSLVSGRNSAVSQVLLLKSLQGVVSGYWFQQPPWWGRDDIHAFFEYFFAPYDPATDSQATKPYAYKRYMQGFTQPWSDHFDMIWEHGNERWNVAGGFWTAPSNDTFSSDEFAAMTANTAIAHIKSSPYWSLIEPNIKFVLGGRYGASTSQTVASNCPDADGISYNVYYGSLWENLAGAPGSGFVYSDEYAYNILQSTATETNPYFASVKNDWLNDLNAGRAKPLRICGYEQNQTTDKLPGPEIPQSEIDAQDEAWYSAAIQVAILDQFLSVMANGFEFCSHFSLSGNGGSYWDIRRSTAAGGGVSLHTQFMSVINRDLLPGRVSFAETPINTRSVVYNTSGVSSNENQVGVYTIEKDDGTLAFAFISRRIPGFGVDAGGGDGVSTVELIVPAGKSSYTRYDQVGAYNQHNSNLANANNLSVAESSGTVSGGMMSLTLQPGSATIISFD